MARRCLLEHLAGEMAKLREAGTYKEELVLQSAQGPARPGRRPRGRDADLQQLSGLRQPPPHPRGPEEGGRPLGRRARLRALHLRHPGAAQGARGRDRAFFGTDDTILYMSCWNANEGLFAAMLEEADGLYSDELNHASIIDGVRLCKARAFQDPHNDLAALERMLEEDATSRYRVLITDGVFSMEGEEADLRDSSGSAHGARSSSPWTTPTRRAFSARPAGHGRGAGGPRSDSRHDRDARQGHGIGGRRIRHRPAGARRDAAPAEPDLPLLQLAAPGGHGRVAEASGCSGRTRPRSPAARERGATSAGR